MNPEVENGENEQQSVHTHKNVVSIMLPFLHCAPLLSDMQPIEQNDAKWYCYMQRGYGIIQRIVSCIEDAVPSFVVEECIHPRNP